MACVSGCAGAGALIGDGVASIACPDAQATVPNAKSARRGFRLSIGPRFVSDRGAAPRGARTLSSLVQEVRRTISGG